MVVQSPGRAAPPGGGQIGTISAESDMKRRVLFLLLLLVVSVLGPSVARADSDGVGLGLTVGAVFPRTKGVEFSDVGLSWGFWVDIPIVWKFAIAPSAEIYNIGGDVGENTATDIDLNFKFIIPIAFTRVFFGAAGGVTVSQGGYDPNVGLLAGVSFGLISNLEAFAMAKYEVVIDDPNTHLIHTTAGLLYVF